MALLRRIRQGLNETVQLYSERLLRVAEDAYPLTDQDHESSGKIDRHLFRWFVSRFLRYKVLREDPKTFAAAVEIAMKEHNLRKRFNLKSSNNFSTLLATNDGHETQFYNHYSPLHRLMSLQRKLNVKIFLMFIVAENTGSVNIVIYMCIY